MRVGGLTSRGPEGYIGFPAASAVHGGGNAVHMRDAGGKPASTGWPEMSVGRIAAFVLAALCLLAIGVYLVSLRGGIGPE